MMARKTHLKELAAHVDAKAREVLGSVGQVGDTTHAADGGAADCRRTSRAWRQGWQQAPKRQEARKASSEALHLTRRRGRKPGRRRAGKRRS